VHTSHDDTNRNAAADARQLLRGAARVLGTVDPSNDVAGLLQGALPLPAGDPRYERTHPFEPHFSETSGGSLSFAVRVPENGPAGSGGVSAASQEVRRMLGANLGRRAIDWFDRRTGAARSVAVDDADAAVVSSFDRDGFREAQVTYLWGPWFTESLPDSALRVAAVVMNGLAGSEPAFTTIRAARTSGSQAMTFRLGSELPLAALKPLMDDLGLGHHHPSLMTSVALVLGARFTLPADSVLLTIRPLHSGLELRLDIDLELVGDVPPNVAELLALQLGERPRSLRALEQWVAAFSPDDDHGPGTLSVLSVTVRPDMAARLSLYVRPRVVTNGATQNPAGAPTREPLAAASGAWR
jgi:hypothetical protein